SEQFPVGVFRTDTLGMCLAVNPRWCQLSGLTEEESLGLGWMTAVHPEDRARVAAEQAAHLQARTPMHIEFRLLRPDGSVIWVLSRTVGSVDGDGKLDGFV